MSFLFLGLDSFDFNLANEYDFEEKLDEDVPVTFTRLEQNLPDVISEKGQGRLNTGHWTFYVWPAIASGQIETPAMEQEHPLPSEVEYPLKPSYYLKHPKSILKFIRNRLDRRPRYKSFAFDDFENVKVINFPMSLPEYNRNADLVRDDAMSRDYGPMELDLLKTEINNALKENYDAIFVVTRKVDCICHGATHPGNFGEDSLDSWFENAVGKSFEEMHQGGMDVRDFADEMELDSDNPEDALKIKQAILDHVEESYDEAADVINSINWDEVDEHMVISDHGFDSLGAGSVNAHGRNAVLSCSFGYWRKISGLIPNWRTALQNKLDEKDSTNEEFEDKSQDEKVKEKLEALGYT